MAVLAYFATTLPPLSLVQESPQPSLILEARSGEVFGYRGIFDGPPAKLANLPDHLVQAVIAIEDRRFHKHFGIDPRAIARAALKNALHWKVLEGGSTITQQLAKIEYLTPERNMARKIQEALIAVRLERHFSKNQILESYLNKVYFGAGAYGVTAAAQRYFGKPPANLTLPESAMLAGLVRSPSRLAPTRNIAGARERARLVLKAMEESHFIDMSDRARAVGALAALVPTVPGSSGKSFFADWVQGETRRALGATFGDFTVRTTLDSHLQAIAERIVEGRLATDGAKLNAKQVALVAMTPDGAIIAMVGGRNYRASQFNRATQGRRQPGSLFKLFVYQTALENGLVPQSIVVDRPVKIGKWAPKNFTKRYRGRITLETAFAKSVNTVAAQLVDKLGAKTVAATAKKMGIRSRLDPTPSLALGTSEATLLELTASYAAVQRGTIGVEPYGIQEITSGGATLYNRTFQPSDKARPLPFRDDILRMLQTAVRSGTGRRAAIDKDVGGKTGTSQGYKDAWFVGFTPRLVVGVWVGNDDGTPMKAVTGGRLPATIWRDFVVAARQLMDQPETLPDAPDVEPWATGTQIASAGPVALPAPSKPRAEAEDLTGPKDAPATVAPPDAAGIEADRPPEPAGTPPPFPEAPPRIVAPPKERPKIESAAIEPTKEPEDEAVRPKESAGSTAPPPRPRRVHVALIPDLATLSPDAAKRRLYRRGLRYRTVGRIESDLPPGTIVKQTPEPALRVPIGKVVSVWIARPAPVATVKAVPPPKAVPRPLRRPRGRGQIAFVPDLSAMKVADAVALLKSRGLSHRRAGTIETDRLAGTVANQEPRADRRVPKGTRVAIWVARAPPKKSTQRVAKADRSSVRPPRPRPTRVARVPRLSRLTLAQADALLKETGLRFRSAGTVESRLPRGTVAQQKPASGQRVKPGTVVSVWTASPALVSVPDLARQQTKQAIALLKRRGLRYRTAGTIESKRPPGSIARQSPGAGQRVKPNTVIALWTAKAALVQVPNLAGKPAAEARSILVRRGLAYRAVASVESALPVGAVADQAPAAGKRVPAGTEITVLTARLPRVVVPDVGRMIPLQARSALRRRGLAYRIAGAVESELPPGWIVRQTPAPGKRVDQETVVSVWIARESLVEVPDLSATRATAAAALLKKRGLRYRRAGTVDSELPAGWVADQKPAAGKRVGKNTVVRIWTARPTSVVGIPRVESTSTLWFGNRRIRLAGVRGLTGRFATSMASYIAGRKVRCRPTTVQAHRCEVDGHDLSEVVLFNGGGRALADAGRNLRDAEAEARRAGRGVWRSRRRSAL